MTSAYQQSIQASARLQQAQAGLHPQLSYTLQAGGSNGDVLQPPPDQETFYAVSNSLNLNLPVGQRPGLLVRQAESQLEATRAQGDSARQTLLGQVITAYYDILRNSALLQVAQETEAEARRQLQDAQRRQRAGDVPELDVIRAQVPLATAQSNVLAAANALHVAQLTFNDLVGHAATETPTMADIADADLVVPWSLEDASSRALARAPEVKAAQATVQAQEAALALARLYRTPAVSLTATDYRSNDLTGFGRLDTVQGQAIFPLSDAGLGRAQVREAQAALDLARSQLETTRKAVLLQSGTAWASADTRIRQLGAARTARDVARMSYDKTRQGYQAGLFPLTDVLTAYASLTQARLAYEQARYDAAAALAALRLQVEGQP